MPWRIALRLERALPSLLRGPVERRALARLAATLRSLVGRDGLDLDATAFFIALFFARVDFALDAARVGRNRLRGTRGELEDTSPRVSRIKDSRDPYANPVPEHKGHIHYTNR